MDSILYERISGLCKARGITITKMATDLGIGTSLIRKWKQTSSPSIDKVKLIAEYFDVSTDYLIGLSNVEEPAEKLMSDDDFVSLQRARNKMSPTDREKMMKMIRLGFDYAFSDEGSGE